jgi:hypothetical protein
VNALVFGSALRPGSVDDLVAALLRVGQGQPGVDLQGQPALAARGIAG